MMTLHGMVPRNKLLFARNFISVLLVPMLFSCAVVAVYQHQIHRMIVSDIELLNLSALEKNIQTLDAVMLSLRELTYSASAGQEMGAFFDSDPQIDAMQKRFDENLDKVSERMGYYRSASPYVENVYAYSSRMDRLVSSTKSPSENLLLNDA